MNRAYLIIMEKSRLIEIAILLQSSRIKCADVDDDARHEIDDDIYDRYNFKIRTLSNCNLSILLQEQEILEAIDTNAAIVLHGPTGSGKTTQVSSRIPCFLIMFQHSNLPMHFAHM